MPSKGILAHAYIAVDNCEVEFTVPGTSIIKNQQSAWSADHLEVESSKLGLAEFTGQFDFKVRRDGQEIAHQHNKINTLTGDLSDGTMISIADQKSIRAGDVVVSYGFYDAGNGSFGLPNTHICYVTVTKDQSDWMAACAPADSPRADKPFTKFVLPCPHDCAMNSMQSADIVLRNPASTFLAETMKSMPIVGEVIDSILRVKFASHIVSNIVYGLAYTQKDDWTTMLALGARYFEFRPGRFPEPARGTSGLGDDFYFMHACIPGMSYNGFLDGILGFLEQHQQEIVVVQLRGDGILSQIERPSEEDKKNILNDALSKHGGVSVGNFDDMRDLTVAQLRQQGKRLIVLDGADQYSSYDDDSYATLTGDTIIDALNKMNSSAANGKALILLQCQATATNIKDCLKHSIVASNLSTSVLMATKATCDMKTMGWLGEHASTLIGQQLVVIMNDFFDGATADTAIRLSTKAFD